MAVIETVSSFGRIAVFGNVSVIYLVINGNGTAYATATGGLPIDLAPALIQGAPFSQPYLAPEDVVDIMQVSRPSANGYYPYGFVLNPANATYQNPAGYPFAGGSAGSIRPDQSLLTCPATIHLTTRAGVEFADGANSDTGIVLALIVARGGPNIN